MAVLTNIPPSLLAALNNPPEMGNRNIWLFTVAKRARHFASPEKVKVFLESIARRWSDRDFGPEIERAVRRAYNSPESPVEGHGTPRWPGFSQQAWERRISHPYGFSMKPKDITSEEVINLLFPDNPLLCMATDTHSAVTKPREDWRGEENDMQFIVANSMTAQTGLNQSQKISNRCLDNATKKRIYQVVEFDRGSFSEQAAILASLSTSQTALALVVWSGGKSLHGWFQVGSLSEYEKLRFFRHAVFLGADASLWDPSKLVRMPGGLRNNITMQDILDFNFELFDL